MTKYNVGDVLEITEDFVLECASYNEGEKYSVVEVGGTHYTLESVDYYFTNTVSEVDAHSGFRKVEPKAEFKAGDKVRLLETAHGSPGYSCDTPEKLKERLAGKGLDYQTVFEVDQEADSDGDVHVYHVESWVGLYVLPEFLVPAEEEDKASEHMQLGKTYKSKGNDLYYRPTEYDFEGGRVLFDYSSDPSDLFGRSKREFDFIEDEFGVLPPAKPEPEPETVSVDALREAYAYVDPEYLDLDKLIELAKRLS